MVYSAAVNRARARAKLLKLLKRSQLEYMIGNSKRPWMFSHSELVAQCCVNFDEDIVRNQFEDLMRVAS